MSEELGGAPLLFMQSSGGLTDAHGFRGKDSILSGPAGGIVGMARTSAAPAWASVSDAHLEGRSRSALDPIDLSYLLRHCWRSSCFEQFIAMYRRVD